MKKISLIVAAATALTANALVVEDHFPSLTKFLEASENWEYLYCNSPPNGNNWLLAFKEKDNEVKYHIRFLNEFREQTQGATAKERLVKIHTGVTGISYNDIIPPNGIVEKNVIKLIRTALAASDDGIGKAYMETAIEALQDRTQTWEQVQQRFTFTDAEKVKARAQTAWEKDELPKPHVPPKRDNPDAFALFTKGIETWKNWELFYTTSLLEGGSLILRFKDKDSGVQFEITLLHRNLKMLPYMRHDPPYTKQHFTISMKSPDDTVSVSGGSIEPSGGMEKKVIALLRDTIATMDAPWDKQLMEFCIDLLQNRTQTWEHVTEQFDIHSRKTFQHMSEESAASRTKWRVDTLRNHPDYVSIMNSALPTDNNTHDTLEAALAAIPVDKSLKELWIYFTAPTTETLTKEIQEWMQSNRPEEWQTVMKFLGKMDRPEILALKGHLEEALAATPTVKRLAAAVIECGLGELEAGEISNILRFFFYEYNDAIRCDGIATFTIKASDLR